MHICFKTPISSKEDPGLQMLNKWTYFTVVTSPFKGKDEGQVLVYDHTFSISLSVDDNFLGMTPL